MSIVNQQIISSYLQNVKKASSVLGNSKSKLEVAFNPSKKVQILSIQQSTALMTINTLKLVRSSVCTQHCCAVLQCLA